MSLAYGCCVGSWKKLCAYVLPKTGARPVTALSGQTSISVAYNTILDAWTGRGLGALVLLHDDLEIIDPDAEAKILAAARAPDVALVGVAGGRNCRSLAWWNYETVGWQLTDSGPLDFGPRTGDVQQIEGSFMVFSPWAIDNLRFDTRYPGFHGYDEIAMQTNGLGKRVVVADIATHHRTTLGFSSPESAQAWLAADRLFRETYRL